MSDAMPPGDVTALLRRGAIDEAAALVHEELCRIACGRLRALRPGYTLDTSALVGEAFLRLTGGAEVAWQDRHHFLAVASRAMRHVLLNHARERRALKRGGGAADLPLTGALQLAAEERAEVLLALDAAAGPPGPPRPAAGRGR